MHGSDVVMTEGAAASGCSTEGIAAAVGFIKESASLSTPVLSPSSSSHPPHLRPFNIKHQGLFVLRSPPLLTSVCFLQPPPRITFYFYLPLSFALPSFILRWPEQSHALQSLNEDETRYGTGPDTDWNED